MKPNHTIKIITQRTLLLILCLWQGVAYTQEFPPNDFKEMRSEESPLGTFKIIQYQHDPDDLMSESQIWLQANKPKFKTQLLFTFSNQASWLISPDDNFIAINNHVTSTDGMLYIFVRGQDGLFKEVKKDFREVTHKLMATQLKLKNEPWFSHEYCYADYWLRDGLLLGHLEGSESGAQFLKPWYFIYNVRKDQFSWDLSNINKGAFGRGEPK